MNELAFEPWLLLTNQISVRWISALLHLLWQGAIIGMLLILGDRFSRNKSATLRYGMHSVALLTLPICVLFTFTQIVVPESLDHSSVSSVDIGLAWVGPNSRPSESATVSDLPAEPHALEQSVLLTSQMEKSGKESLSIAARSGFGKSPVPPTPISPLTDWTNTLGWINAAYILGVLVFSLRLSAALWGGRRIRQGATRLQDVAILRIISDQARNVGLRFVPVVVYCERVSVPTVVGILKPIVLLPASILSNLSPQEFSAILAHEFAHIHRYDLWMNLAQRIIESLFFFHPVVWFISRRISQERELCCDDLVVSIGNEPLDYAGALLRMAELCVLVQKSDLATLAAGGHSHAELEHRIKRLMNLKSHSQLRLTRVGFMILLGLILSGVAMPAMLGKLVQPSESQGYEVSNSDTALKEEPQLDNTISGHVSSDLKDVQITAKFELEEQDINDSLNPTYLLVHTSSDKTDREGNFSIEVPKEQIGNKALVVSFRYELTGYFPRTIGRVYVDDLQFPNRRYDDSSRSNRQKMSQLVRDTRLKKARPLKGRVLLPDDSPAVGAIVVTDSKYRAYSWKFPDELGDYRASSFTTTDANGDFELQTDHSATLVVQLAGHAPVIIDDLYGGVPLVSMKSDDPLSTFRVPIGIRPSGIVRTYDGKPIAGAILSVSRAFEWNEFNMPLGFSISVAANEQGEFQLPPLPADHYKVTVTAKLEDVSRVAEYNTIASNQLNAAMRAMYSGEWSKLNPQKPLPKTVLIHDVLLEQEWELTAAVQSPKFALESIEAVSISVRIIDQTRLVDDKRAVDATIHGVFAGQPWHGVSRKAETDGVVRLTAPKRVSNLVIGTGHAFHRRSPDAELQLGDAIHLGSVDKDVEGLEVIKTQPATLNVSLKLPPEIEHATNVGKEHIHFQTYYVREGYLEKSPSPSRMYLARTVQTNGSQYQAMALPNEEFILKITKGIPSGQTDLYEERITLNPGEILDRTIDLTKAVTLKEERGVDPAGIQWGQLVDGLRLGIRPKPTARRSLRLRQGDRMEYEVWIKNETTSVVHIKMPRSEVFGPAAVEQGIDLLEHKVTIFSAIDIASVTINPGDARLCETSVTTLCVEDRKMIYPLQIGLGKHTVYAAKRYDYLLGGYVDEARSDSRQIELRSGEQQIEVLPAARLLIKEARESTGTFDSADPSTQLWDWQTTDGKNLKVIHLRYGEVLVDEDDIQSAQAIPAAWDPSFYSIELTLKPQTDTALVTATKQMSLRVNDRPLLAILFDGKLLSALKIDAPIADRKVTLTGRFNRQQAEETAKLLATIRQVNLPVAVQQDEQNETEDADAKQLVTFDTDPISICQVRIKSWDEAGKHVLACKARERLAERLAIISKKAVESFTRPAPKSDSNMVFGGERVDVQVALDGHWSTGKGTAADWQDWITRKQAGYSHMRMQILYEAAQGFRKHGELVAARRVLQSGLTGNSIYDMPLAQLIADHWPVKGDEPEANFGTGHFGGPYAAPHAWTLINYLNDLAQVQNELVDVEHAKETQSRHMLANFMMSWDQPAAAPTQSAGQLWNLLRENPQTLPPLFWFNVLEPNSASIKFDFTDAIKPKSPLRFHGQNVVAAPTYDFDQLTITAEFHSKSGIIDLYTVPQSGKQTVSLGTIQPKSDGAADQTVTQLIQVPAGTGLIQFRLGGEGVRVGLVKVEATFKKREGFANVLTSGETPVNEDLQEITELIAAGKLLPQKLNEKYQAVHRRLTAAERLKSIKLLVEPDFVLQDILSEPTYPLEEKIALLSELADHNFESGLQEWMVNVATQYAEVDPVSTRKWLATFHGADYAVGMGLEAVLKAAKQKDQVASLAILGSLSDEEAELLLSFGDIPKYDLPASEWLEEVQRFQSQRLRSYYLGGPMVFRFGEESPEAALDYILSIPKELQSKQLGYQLVSSLIRSKRFTGPEVLDWMETKLPLETRSHEHYGLLASYWSQQDNASFQAWFQSLTDAAIRDEIIIGFAGAGQPQDWPEIFKMANQISDQTKRQSKVAWVLDAWKLTDPAAALAQLEKADISKERRSQLQRDITARLAQVPKVLPVASTNAITQPQDKSSEKADISEREILGQWESGPYETGVASQAKSISIKFSDQGKFDRYDEWPNQVEYATGSWRLDGKQVQVKYKAVTLQPGDNKETEETLKFESPDTLVLGTLSQNKVRFQRRMGIAAKAVNIDAKHPLHELAKELMAKLNAGTSAEPSAAWHVLQFNDTPAIKLVPAASGFDASKATSFRLLLARDYQEFANTMQQLAALTTERPFRLRTEQMEIVLFATQPQKAPADLKSSIDWLSAKSQWPTRDMCLGDGLGFTWFVRAPLQVCHSLQSELKLADGDDMVVELVQSTIFKKDFPPDSDVYTASAILGTYGDRAVVAIEQAVRQKKPQDDLWHTIRSLAAIRSDASNKLLLQLFQSTNNDLHKAAAYALITKPYRKELASVFVDMLKNREGVEEASEASVELGLKDAIPHLKELVSKPSSVRELNTTFTAQRILEGNPIPKYLLEASEIIFQSRTVDPAAEGSVIGNAIKQFLDSSDHEAVVVLALQMVNYTTKGDVDPIRSHGAAILKAQKSAAAVLFLASILDSLPQREREEVLQRINPLIASVPAAGLNPFPSPYQNQNPPAMKPIPAGPRKHVATIFGTMVHLDQLEPTESELTQKGLSKDEVAAKRIELQGEALLRIISRRAVEDYVRREKIEVTQDRARQLWDEVQKRDLPATPDISEQDQRMAAYAMSILSLKDWLVCKSLYERYGGRVGMGSLGMWIAVDGRNELMREYLKKGSIEIKDAELEKAFWKAANKPNFADAYPQGEVLKRLMASPPQLSK